MSLSKVPRDFLRPHGIRVVTRFDDMINLREGLIEAGFHVRSIQRTEECAPLWEVRLARATSRQFARDTMLIEAVRVVATKLGPPVDRDSIHAAGRVTVAVSMLWRDGPPGLMKEILINGKQSWCYSPDWQSPVKLIRDRPAVRSLPD